VRQCNTRMGSEHKVLEKTCTTVLGPLLYPSHESLQARSIPVLPGEKLVNSLACTKQDIKKRPLCSTIWCKAIGGTRTMARSLEAGPRVVPLDRYATYLML